MTPELSTLHQNAIAALNEALAARVELTRSTGWGTQNADAKWADERAFTAAKAAIDALAVFAECLEIKAKP